MLEKVDEFLATQRARDLGLKSRADVMREALKDLLRKEGVL
jgi:Arc/MetJ-type ribon-helix-helix transcriptional regulator